MITLIDLHNFKTKTSPLSGLEARGPRWPEVSPVFAGAGGPRPPSDVEDVNVCARADAEPGPPRGSETLGPLRAEETNAFNIVLIKGAARLCP
ncbi:hypothetical protein EVAR_21410_1 [Eumeta japonica]|uniref:Uncharacterized protein n=1 Tax=Eumeta variegata TaxID=151549 RepID=A0A4C1VJI9_EUMVA|nr:hypothetical protein EVAR_21410_1 [Eumeta japonica]